MTGEAARFATLVCTALLATGPAAADPIPAKVVGVRVDARPFAWLADDNDRTYRGYLVDLCFGAVTRAGYHFDAVPMDATARKAVLDGDFKVKGRQVDLVCDPTTVTLARLDNFVAKGRSEAVFTPIVYVANGSYVRHDEFEDRQPCEIGKQGETRPACSTKKVRLDNGTETTEVIAPTDATIACYPRTPAGEGAAYFIAGHVVGTTAEDAINRAQRLNQIRLLPSQSLCTLEVLDHRDGVRKFCENRYHFYFGDLDIIGAYAQALHDDGVSCDLKGGERALSYEPYALLITSGDATFRARVIAAVYEIFADGTAAGLFDAYFPGHGKSEALSILFRINSIPGLRPRANAPAPREAASTAAAGNGGRLTTDTMAKEDGAGPPAEVK